MRWRSTSERKRTAPHTPSRPCDTAVLPQPDSPCINTRPGDGGCSRRRHSANSGSPAGPAPFSRATLKRTSARHTMHIGNRGRPAWSPVASR